MSDDLVSLKIAVVSEMAAERELLSRAASQASVPIETIEIEQAATAEAVKTLIENEAVDVIFLDSRMARAERQAVMEAVRVNKAQPLVILVGSADYKTRQVVTDGLAVDGVLAKPIELAEAKTILDACVRARIPSRALVVDDSATVRSVVKKVLQASRFKLECEEADDGAAALERMRSQHYDVVFLDCHMPGLDGWATLDEVKRRYPRSEVVMITGTTDDKMAERARAAGAKDLLFKPFYAKDIDALLNRVFGLMPNKSA